MLSPHVAVIILNWNGWQDTSACVRSLQESTYPNYNILLVDNGSTDDSVARLREQFPDLEILETGENLGFAKGNNAGMAHVLAADMADYVWLLNNDTLVQPSTLAELIQTADNIPHTGALGAVLMEADRPDVVQEWGGRRMCLWTGIAWPASSKRPPNYICGASLFLRKACLTQCGLFDPEYFFFFEDTDLGYRIRNQGWDIHTAQLAVVLHKGSASVGTQSHNQFYWYRRGLIRFLLAHAPFPWLPILGTTAARLLLSALARNGPVFRGTWNGFWDGLKETRSTKTSTQNG